MCAETVSELSQGSLLALCSVSVLLSICSGMEEERKEP